MFETRHAIDQFCGLFFFNSIKDNQKLFIPSPADKCGMKQPGQIYSQQNIIMITITHRFI